MRIKLKQLLLRKNVSLKQFNNLVTNGNIAWQDRALGFLPLSFYVAFLRLCILNVPLMNFCCLNFDHWRQPNASAFMFMRKAFGHILKLTAHSGPNGLKKLPKRSFSQTMECNTPKASFFRQESYSYENKTDRRPDCGPPEDMDFHNCHHMYS